jgi:hypothetical protein
MSALLEYECQVPVKGYEVITADSYELITVDRTLNLETRRGKFRMLHPRSERTKRFNLFEVRPSAPPAFLEFAQTSATEDGIKAFADRYGQLFPDGPNLLFPDGLIPPPGLEKSFQIYQFYGRLINTWSLYIRAMHRDVELWNMSMRTGDFSKIIRDVQRKRPPGDHPARGYLKHPALGSTVELFLKEDPSSASARLCIRPNSLAYALWAQLLLAIDGNLNLRACVHCRKWFTLEAGRGRSDKEYCSNACRMRAYRKRKVSG